MPVVSIECPSDGYIDVFPNPTLLIYIIDFQGDTMNIMFMTNVSGSCQ